MSSKRMPVRILERWHSLRQKPAQRVKINELARAIVASVDEQRTPAELRVHPLGFLYAYLAAFEDGGKIRLHIWPNDQRFAQVPIWPIHDHAFSFVSWVIAGEILNEEYDISCVSDPNARVYSVAYTEHHSILSPTTRLVRSVITSTTIAKTGEHYSMNSGTFHQSKMTASGLGVTLMITTPSGHTEPLVLGDIQSEPVVKFERRTLGAEEAKAWFSNAIQSFEDSGLL